MRKAVVVSFEDEIIRVIYARVKGKDNILVDDALILKEKELDNFLLKEKTKEFIVVSGFKDFFQDIILIPPAKKRFTKRLIEAEIEKRSHFKDFSFLYTISGEKIVEQRRMKEVFAFAVKNKEIKDIVNRFVLKGKIVKAIYHDIFSIASLVQSEPAPFLCVSETGLNKNTFLIKDGVIQFIRVAQSTEKGIRDIDIQSINMTTNYCRQVLKINPTAILLVGSPCHNYSVTMNTLIPIACLSQRLLLAKKDPVYLDFISPLSALFISKERDINLLPREYKHLFRTKLFLKYSTGLFLTFSIIGLGYAGYTGKNIFTLKHRIDSIRINLSDIDNTLSIYNTKKTELAVYLPLLKPFKNTASIPDIQRFLSLLSELKTDNVRINSMSLTVSNDILNVKMNGLVKAEHYANTQMFYQKFIDSIASLKGVSIKDHELELKDKSFHIEIEWRSLEDPLSSRTRYQ